VKRSKCFIVRGKPLYITWYGHRPASVSHLQVHTCPPASQPSGQKSGDEWLSGPDSFDYPDIIARPLHEPLSRPRTPVCTMDDHDLNPHLPPGLLDALLIRSAEQEPRLLPLYCVSCHLDRSQDRPSRSAIAPFDLYRQADVLVLSRFHLREVQTLYNPDPGFKERLVRLDAIPVEATN
jgi:hypothetical protein